MIPDQNDFNETGSDTKLYPVDRVYSKANQDVGIFSTILTL